MSNRDDFSPNTKAKVALRANHHCSFRGCPQITSGPSDESTAGVNMIGKAAHIHGAAAGRGSRRYLASMSREERSDITNAIWLCANHADLIDGDEVTYSADDLRAMKREHEDNIRVIQRNAIVTGESVPDLVAIGPDIVFTGEFLGVENDAWSLRLHHFVDGDVHSLITFIDRYEQTSAIDRYVLVNVLGDGRALKDPPSMARETAGTYIVRCPVLPSANRIRAADLPKSWALSDSHDLTVKDGNWAAVSGLDALPQQIKTCLSHQRGESPFHRDFGTRFADYYRLLSDSPWLCRYLKLEVIRLASIPYSKPGFDGEYTPLQCIERVYGVEILADVPTSNWLPIRVDLDVKGLGRWRHELSICVPPEPIKRPSIDDLLAGPVT